MIFYCETNAERKAAYLYDHEAAQKRAQLALQVLAVVVYTHKRFFDDAYLVSLLFARNPVDLHQQYVASPVAESSSFVVAVQSDL